MTQTGDPTAWTFDGSCHCGNIGFALAWPDARTIAVRACGCSFCRKHHAAWTSHPEARLTVRYRVADKVERYRFGTETADFHICKACGVVPFVTGTIDNTLYGIVNVNCLDDLGDIRLAETPKDFEGESVTARLGRREQNWIPDVTIEDGG